MKKTFLTLTLALMMGFVANAQNEMWDTPVESSYEVTNLGMFDWANFTELFDQASQSSASSEWYSDFSLFDFGSGDRDGVLDLILPDHGLDTDINAPLGSGIVMLLGMGGAYLFAKRRKEEE